MENVMGNDDLLLKNLDKAAKEEKALAVGTVFDVEPVDGWIHVEKVPIKDLKTKGGILIPDNINEKAVAIRVLAVGNGELCPGTGEHMSPPVKAGDYILADATRIINVSYSGQDCLVVDRTGIFCKIRFKQDPTKS
jgi:co-chaperonin GroES (HSP10)